MEVKVAMRQNFFDREVVIASIGAARAKAFAQLGGYIQRTAQRSMRRQKKASPPGRPPAFHSSSAFNLRSIEFSLSRKSRSLLVGPLRTNSPKARMGKTVPRLHEHGGTAPINEWRLIPQGDHTEKRLKRNKKLASQFNVWMHPGHKLSGTLNGMGKVTALPKDLVYSVERRTRMARYAKRSFMRPALVAAKDKVPHLFRNVMRPVRKPRKVNR